MLELKSPTAQYFIVTLNYWAFTLTDGALRLLVLRVAVAPATG